MDIYGNWKLLKMEITCISIELVRQTSSPIMYAFGICETSVSNVYVHYFMIRSKAGAIPSRTVILLKNSSKSFNEANDSHTANRTTSAKQIYFSTYLI